MCSFPRLQQAAATKRELCCSVFRSEIPEPDDNPVRDTFLVFGKPYIGEEEEREV